MAPAGPFGKMNLLIMCCGRGKVSRTRSNTFAKTRYKQGWRRGLKSTDGCGRNQVHRSCGAGTLARDRAQECARHTFSIKGKGQSCLHDWPLFMPATTAVYPER